jgi:hypothetical protein
MLIGGNMTTAGTVYSFARFLAGMPGFLRRGLSEDEALQSVQRSLANRDAGFIDLLERAVYGYERSPYRALLDIAGCELGDVRALVRDKGIEETLRDLRRAGVYVTFEESKGRAPIVRSGRTIDARPEDFDNPLLGGALNRATGGSTGAPTIVRLSLRDLAEKAPVHVLGYKAHGLLGIPTATLREAYTGLGAILTEALFGAAPERWFAPYVQRGRTRSIGATATLRLIALAGRLGGERIPMPEPLHYDEFGVVADWAAARVRSGGRTIIRTNASHALRVAAAALARGIDLEGVTFMGGGDPATPGKLSRIAASGARYVPVYIMSETGRIGVGCVNPIDGSDVHLLHHLHAVIAYPRTVPGTDVEVESFHFTSMRTYSPKIMLNTESDDYGVIEKRACGCLLEEAGFPYHLRDIFSFRKLTSGGVTLVGSRMVEILDDILPAKFGGSGLDYQLVEEEEAGFTKLSLVVDPRVGDIDESAVVQTVLGELGDDRISQSVRSIWEQTETLRVIRRRAGATGRGKIIPLAPGNG